MKIVVDISKEKYDEIMSMDWVNCGWLFDEELRAIHDGKVLPKGHESNRKVRNNMATYEITAEINLKRIIAESREVAQALNEFADQLERIESKYAEPRESENT